MSSNQYADTDAPFTTDATVEEGAIMGWISMQTRVFEENQHKPAFNKAMYSQTAEDFAEAYAAGYEQAERCNQVFGRMTFNNSNPIGIRNNTGIRYAGGVAAVAFKAGYNARVNA